LPRLLALLVAGSDKRWSPEGSLRYYTPRYAPCPAQRQASRVLSALLGTGQ
jgi:hypothetical protein